LEIKLLLVIQEENGLNLPFFARHDTLAA